jgi:hypothetical protein
MHLHDTYNEVRMCISRHADSEFLAHMDVRLCICTCLDMHMTCLWNYSSLLLYKCNNDVMEIEYD